MSITIYVRNKPATVRPKLLLHGSIPLSLSGVNPRTIEGKEWWDKIRRQVYKSNNRCCEACGIFQLDAPKQWLEAHECYEYDYQNRIAKFTEIVPLCRTCHRFIHWRRIPFRVLFSRGYNPTLERVLRHGLDTLKNAGEGIEQAAAQYSVYARLFGVADLGWKLEEEIMERLDKELKEREIQLLELSWRLIYKGEEYDRLSARSPIRT